MWQVGYHPDFESSRCLFIVRKDGEMVDFSYWKCIKGLIRKNYPLYADSFILRHFRRRRHNNDWRSQNPSFHLQNIIKISIIIYIYILFSTYSRITIMVEKIKHSWPSLQLKIFSCILGVVQGQRGVKLVNLSISLWLYFF